MRFIPLAAAAAAAAFIAGTAAAQTTPRSVYFALGSDRIDSQAQQVIDSAARDFEATGAAAVDIVGHTDTTGSAEVNEALSRRRASAVAEALADRGVPPNAIETSARGKRDLAVPTGDNVAERRNRRVDISFVEAEPEPSPIPPPPAQAPQQQMMPGLAGMSFGIGPYFARNFQEGDNSYMAGVNLSASFFAMPNLAVGAEQAVFYNFDSSNDGWGSRTAVGADWHFVPFGQGEGVIPYVGANIGRTFIDGSGVGGWFAGPEVGVDVFGFNLRVAYDMYFADPHRDLDDGVLSATIGYELRF